MTTLSTPASSISGRSPMVIGSGSCGVSPEQKASPVSAPSTDDLRIDDHALRRLRGGGCVRVTAAKLVPAATAELINFRRDSIRLPSRLFSAGYYSRNPPASTLAVACGEAARRARAPIGILHLRARPGLATASRRTDQRAARMLTVTKRRMNKAAGDRRRPDCRPQLLMSATLLFQHCVVGPPQRQPPERIVFDGGAFISSPAKRLSSSWKKAGTSGPSATPRRATSSGRNPRFSSGLLRHRQRQRSARMSRPSASVFL